MTTYFPFTPSSRAAPQFRPTLDGTVYTVVVTWNVFGQRYYVNCYSQDGGRVFTLPLIESSEGIAIQTLSWDPTSHTVQATALAPHGLKLGSVVNLVITGCNPTSYNGSYACAVTSPTTFTYPMQFDPGLLMSAGAANYLVSMTAGYFSSTLVYRARQFEVSP